MSLFHLRRHPPTPKEVAIRALKWRSRFRNLESFIVNTRYGLWGWQRWLRSLHHQEPQKLYGTLGGLSVTRNCPKCGVLEYWPPGSVPQGDFACPICGEVQNLQQVPLPPSQEVMKDATPPHTE